MTTMEPEVAERLRQTFKAFNRFMLLIWRLGLGGWLNAWPDVGGRILVLTHTGRKTGLKRRTPLNYAVVGGELYCTAGFGHIADWYRNVLANPEVEIWLPDGWWAGTVADISDQPDYLPLMREVIIGSGAVGPLFGIRPKTMSDEELAAVVEGYKLLHVRRTEARTGPGGPGDLAWFWPATTMALLPLLFRRRRGG